MEKVCYSKSPLSYDELEKYRDENGFIDLNEANLVVVEGSRNQIGSTDIFKYWVDFNGTKVLLKQEKMLDGEQNGSMYSELIMNALCENMRIRSAKTDVFKYGEFKGLISHLAFDPEKESMIMIRELIGDIPSDGDTFDFKTVEDKIKEGLISQFELSDKDAEVVILKRRLQKIIQLYSSEMDNHLENEALLFSRDEDGKYHIRSCPMFDNELSFGLHATFSEMMQDSLYDSLQVQTPLLRHAIRSMKKGQPFNKQEMEALEEVSSSEELRDIILGNLQLRNRVVGNGKQVVMNTSGLPRYFSKSDATLAYLYQESSDAVDNPDLDEDIIELHENILDFIADIHDLSMEDIISDVEEKVKLPSIVKTQLIRFSKMKTEVLGFVMEGVGEIDYYEQMAENLMQYKEKDKANSQEIE